MEDDFVLTESRAIAVYVAQKFGTKGQLFPEDLKEQAAVNEKLYFDTNVLWRSFAEVFVSFYLALLESLPILSISNRLVI